MTLCQTSRLCAPRMPYVADPDGLFSKRTCRRATLNVAVVTLSTKPAMNDRPDVPTLTRLLAANRQLREEKAALMLRVREAEAAVVRVREEFRGDEITNRRTA